MSKYETHKLKDPKLPFIFHISMNVTPKSHKIQDNWHENFEMLAITEGSGTVYLDGVPHSISAGSIVAINSNILHTVISEVEEVKYHCLIVDRSFCLSNFFDTNELWFEECFSDDSIFNEMKRLAEYYSAKNMDKAQIVAVRAGVLRIMAELCERHSCDGEEKRVESHLLSAIKRAIGYIRSEYSRDLSLDEVAAFAGLSKYYFAHEFRRITEYTFVEYVNILRCERAKKLLLNSELSVWEIGVECGFQNRAYFTRTFVKYTGCSPSSFRRQNL